MRAWFIPCWSGDFRLEPDPNNAEGCLLTVDDPSALDRERLAPFLVEARARGWMDAAAGIAPSGRTVLPVSATIRDAGPILAEQVLPDGPVWTALRSVDGSVTLLEGTARELHERIRFGLEHRAGVGRLLEAAVTLAPPRRGCPPPSPAPTRASQVLAAFSTRRQLGALERYGFMPVHGGASGRVYQVFHRDAARRRGLGHCVVDVERGEEICAWDDRVPAEEEVLALKLALEHREAWLLQVRPGRAAQAFALPARRAA